MSTDGPEKYRRGGLPLQNARVEKVNRDISFHFTEGPAWDGKGKLYFSDVRSSRTYTLDAGGRFCLFRDSTNGGNGLAFNHADNLLTCEKTPAITETDPETGQVIRIIASHYREKPLNAPNDLVVDRKGGIYFSDPDFSQRPPDQLPQEIEAVYYITPKGEVMRVCQDAIKPNGVVLSPDGQLLYVADTYDRHIWAYGVRPGGDLANGHPFAELQVPDWPALLLQGDPFTRSADYPSASLADGMTVDSAGNLYVTTRLGVQVLDSGGAHLGIIQVPEVPTNCTFGGPDLRTLYITARTSVYRVVLPVAGVLFTQ